MVLHGPRTQTCGETTDYKAYVLDRIKVCIVLELKPFGKIVTPKPKCSTEPRSFMVLELKPMGKLVTPKPKCSTEPRSFMVLELKPMGKLITPKPKC